MTFSKIDQISILKILESGVSLSVALKCLKKQNITISKAQLAVYRKNGLPLLRPISKKNRSGRKSTLSNRQISNLKQMVRKKNAPTQKSLATHFKTTRSIITYTLKKKIGVKLIKKPLRHFLSEQMIKKRHRRSFGLYKELNCNKWQKYITVDEAWFYLSNVDGQRRVQYISREETVKDANVFEKQAHPKGVMVFMGISYNGVTEPIFVDPGAKINSDYYINNCLKPLIHNAKSLYPDNNWKFHQDSAPAHTSKKTLKFLADEGIDFLTPEIWTPNSPDLSPCDYFLWGYLKKILEKRELKTISQLKKIIRTEVQNIPLEMIRDTLKSWPKRCLEVYKNKGHHLK